MNLILKNKSIKRVATLTTFIFITLITFISGSNIVKAARVYDEPLKYHGRSMMYWRYYNLDDFHADSWADGSYYEVDGTPAYCIEPGVHTEDGLKYPEGTTDGEGTELDRDTLQELSLIAYFGYGYKNHDSLRYYMAAQGLIWDVLLNDDYKTTYWYYKPNQKDKLDLSDEQNEILELMEDFYVSPSFNRNTYTLQVGQSITLNDDNNVLKNFKVDVSGADYELDNNSLTITPTQEGTINVKLIKKQEYNKSTLFYHSSKYQDLMTVGRVDPFEAQFTINSYKTTIELNKTDSETGVSQGQSTLKGAEYGVFETATGNRIAILVTDENGFVKSAPILSWKDYYIQEIKPSEGYELDTTRYNIDVKGKDSIKIDVVEKVIKNYVSILKQYEFVEGDTKFLNAESGITFEIYYPNGNLYDTIITDKNGYASINLPYGSWKFHQVNTSVGFEKIYDFYINITENSNKEQYYNILNNALSAYLQVIKVDEETGRVIAIADTTFKILNVDTNQYVSQYVGGKVISEFKTDENGILVTPLKLSAGNYKLIETSAPNGYLKDPNGLQFSIGNDTHYNYTTHGAFVTVTYRNVPIKGKLEIHKTGEDLIIEDGKYIYDKKALSEVTFEIYAEEDILSSDGTHLYYSKGDKVDTITTDENGYACTINLPLGKYYFIEVKTQDEYILDENKHYFSLKQVDDVTPIVYELYSALNYLKKATIEITKTDLVNGDVIPNTILEIYTKDDELIFTGKTDKDGKIIITDLKVGEYYIMEKEPSTGYVLTTEKVYFELKENGEIVKAEMKNKPITGTLEFTKTDVAGDSLPNTLIEIYNDKNELIFSGRTDEEGKITIPEIRYGKYYILEKEAPEGYTLNPEKIYFEILEDGEIVKATMLEEKVIVEVPSTGIINFHLTEIAGALLIITGIGAIIYDKKKK